MQVDTADVLSLIEHLCTIMILDTPQHFSGPGYNSNLLMIQGSDVPARPYMSFRLSDATLVFCSLLNAISHSSTPLWDIP
jgi:hypothetical protein